MRRLLGRLGREDWLCVGALAVMPALFLAPSLFAGRVLLPADLMLLSSPWRDAGHMAFPDFRQAYNGMLDPLHQHYPWKTYLARSFREGRIPLWNPYQFCGQPFAANGQSAVFYPPNAWFALIEPARAFAWVAWFHLCLAGLSLYALNRDHGCRPAASLAGAAAFQFCGLFVVTLQFTSYLATMAWLPVVVLAGRRAILGPSLRWAGVGAVGVALQLLAGHMQYAVYAFFAAAVYFAFLILRPGATLKSLARSALLAGLPFVLGALIATIHLLPCLEMGLLSGRRGGVTYAAALTLAMPSRQLLGLLVPDPFGNPVDCGEVPRFIENCPYLGIGPLFLLPAALIGSRRRERWVLAGLFAAGLLLAFGTHANWLLFRLVPGFSQLTGLGRAIYLSAFAGGGLAALGVEALLARAEAGESNWLRTYGKALGAASLGATAILAGFALTALQSPQVTDTLAPFYQKVYRTGLAPPEVLLAGKADPGLITPYAVDAFLAHIGRRTVGFLALITGLLVATALAAREGKGPEDARRARGTAGWAFALVVAADVFAYGVRFNPQLPFGMLKLASPALGYLGAVERPVRVISPAPDGNPLRRLPPNLGIVCDLQDANGSDSLYTKAYVSLLSRIADPRTPGFAQPDPASPVVDLLSVGYVVTEADLDGLRGMARVSEGRLRVYENRRAFPRAWVAGRTRTVASYPAAMEALVDSGTDFRKEVVVVGGREAEGPGLPGRVAVSRYEPQRVSLEGEVPAGAWTVLADAYYPGWRAWADGAPVPVSRVDYVLRGVRPAQPARRVEMAYAPASFKVGAFASGLGLAMVAGLGCFAWRRRGAR